LIAIAAVVDDVLSLMLLALVKVLRDEASPSLASEHVLSRSGGCACVNPAQADNAKCPNKAR
jgi:hypothetical protein